MRISFLLLSIACTATNGGSDDSSGARDEQTQFVHDETVQIIEPTNGAVVDESFEVVFTVGDDVRGVRLFSDGLYLDGIDEPEETERMDVSLEQGAHKLTLVGIGENGTSVSEHSLTIQVVTDEADPWVMITSPADLDTPTNPVRFTVASSEQVDTVEILADGWTLGIIDPDEVLSFEFSGTGFARNIEALAYDDGELIASDTITITVFEGTTPEISDWNEAINGILSTYPTDGSYAYYWPSSGSWGGNPSDIFYLDDLFAEGDSQNRSYCVGLTLEVFMRAFDQIDSETGGDGTVNGIPFDELYDFKTDWYVREINGRGIVDAMENYGIGELVTDWDDVLTGDIIQFWRHSGSGHNAIFMDWVVDEDGTRTGFEYWGTQGSTDGIGYNEESFGSSGSSVDPNLFFPGRLWMPVAWESW